MEHGFFQARAAEQGKRDRTRAALLDATIAVVARKGMEAAKISDITTEAGLANGTFYNHFTSKEEIVHAVAYGLAVEVSRRLDEDMAGVEDAAARVVTATARFVSIMVGQPEWAAVMLEGTAAMPDVRQDAYQYLRSDLERGIAQRRFAVETADAFMVEQVASLVAAAIRAQLERGADASLTRQVCENILRLLGFSPAEARKAVASYCVQPA